MDQPSTSRGSSRNKQSHTPSKQKRSRLQLSQDTQDEEGEPELNMEPGFIAQATANSRLFIDAYNELVKIYPDSRQNFEVKLTKLLETYLSAAINNTTVDNPDAAFILDFARASMVLQGASRIYSKKVEYLCLITLQLLGFVDCGIAQQGEEETADGAGPAHAPRRTAQKDTSFEIMEMKPNRSSLKVKLDRKVEKKLAFRPKCFPALIRQEQSDIDKKRITTLNPTFTGDKTTFRLWGPISSKEGHLVLDLSNIKYKFARNADEVHDPDKDIDDWNNDDGDINIEPFVDTPEPENGGAEETVEEADSITVEKTANAAASAREMIADAEEDKENTNVSIEGTDAWDEMSIDEGVNNKNLNPKIKSATPNSKKKLPIQDALLHKIMNKVAKKKNCFGEEGQQEGIELREQNKMLPLDASKSKRKRDAPSLAPPQTETDKSVFDNNDSDADDVIGFDQDGKTVYATKGNGPGNNDDDDEISPPNVTIDDWGAPENDDNDVISSLTGPRLSTAPTAAEAAKENGFYVPEIQEDIHLASKLDAWFKKINPRLDRNAAKPQFTFNSYCQEVLKRFPEDQDKLKFSEIMKELPAGQTARYLLATLQLANTNNVEIQGNIPGQVSNDTMEVILLNKTRVLPSFDDE